MLSIGEFSKVCKVTTRTLRLYDEIDLIKPNFVNEENGYRYYDVSQVRDMLFVSRLKGYNFTLEEIKEILAGNTIDYTLSKFINKEKELEEIINKNLDIKNQMQNDINRLKKGYDIMSFVEDMEVSILETKDMNIVSNRQIMSVNDYGKYIGKVYEVIARNKLKAVGAPMSIYYDNEKELIQIFLMVMED